MVELVCDGMLFDLDGVLVDSTPAVARVWSKWAIAHGLDPEETVRVAHGRPSIATVRDIMPDADYELENEVILRGELEDTEGVVQIPGARELLESLPLEHWALGTSCARPRAEVRLKAAGLPIPEKMITCEDVRIGKPDPEPYQKGAALLGVPASRCIVFEDAPAGIRSGKSAGATVIALRSTSTDDELEAAGADWIVTGYADLGLSRSSNGSGSLKLAITDAHKSL
jgi:mannitol-1-/sugar-/sorbitol-6-phosphatase